MKKLFVFPILFLYMLAVSGVLVHVHYCGGEMESWSFFQKAADACGGDGCDDEVERIAEEDGCCKDKVVSAKLTTEQAHSEKAIENLFSAPAILPLPFFTGFFPQEKTLVSGREKLAYSANAPPGRWQNLPLYKLHMRFTFYG